MTHIKEKRGNCSERKEIKHELSRCMLSPYSYSSHTTPSRLSRFILCLSFLLAISRLTVHAAAAQECHDLGQSPTVHDLQEWINDQTKASNDPHTPIELVVCPFVISHSSDIAVAVTVVVIMAMAMAMAPAVIVILRCTVTVLTSTATLSVPPWTESISAVVIWCCTVPLP
jgi:hypothetical protein